MAEEIRPQQATPGLVLVKPQPGVTIYAGGKHGAFEPGRAVPLHADHADDLVADGHAAYHDADAQQERLAAKKAAAEAAAAPEADSPQDKPQEG